MRGIAHLAPDVGGASRDRTGDLLLAKQALSQLSYGPGSTPPQVVGLGRFELPASPLSGVRSDQLSYRPFGSKAAPDPASSIAGIETGNLSGDSRKPQLAPSFKGGDPAARSRTATLLRLHPSH